MSPVSNQSSSSTAAGTSPAPVTSSRKLVLLGESAVGKSSLVLQFVKQQFDEWRESTIGTLATVQHSGLVMVKTIEGARDPWATISGLSAWTRVYLLAVPAPSVQFAASAAVDCTQLSHRDLVVVIGFSREPAQTCASLIIQLTLSVPYNSPLRRCCILDPNRTRTERFHQVRSEFKLDEPLISGTAQVLLAYTHRPQGLDRSTYNLSTIADRGSVCPAQFSDLGHRRSGTLQIPCAHVLPQRTLCRGRL